MLVLNKMAIVFLLSIYFNFSESLLTPTRHHPNIIPPSHTSYHATKNKKTSSSEVRKRDEERYTTHGFVTTASTTTMVRSDRLSNMTLRQFLSHNDGFHLGIAPAFFGFFVYFGALAAFNEYVLTEEEIKKGKVLLPINTKKEIISEPPFHILRTRSGPLLKSISGASAGAMAAVLLAAGIDPKESAKFASTMTLGKFWDFPGVGGMIKGDLFEEIIVRHIKTSRLSAVQVREGGCECEKMDQTLTENIKLEDSLIPVAVSGFDILNRKGKIITKGCMGKATRASATFPGLFQPCKWKDDNRNNNDANGEFQYLIDGGVGDILGLAGLGHLRPDEKNKRILNLVAGTFGYAGPLGPSRLPEGIHAKEVVSISIENAPKCGPWSMQNGPIAFQAAMNAIKNVLDAPMYHGDEEGHYVLHVDVTDYITN